jgi:UDP-N-acetylmuramoylalanine--D-glutamate ligase
VVVFKGLLEENTTVFNVETQNVKFKILGMDSIINKVDVPFSSLLITDDFNNLIYKILKSAFGKKVHIGGNVKGYSTLALLEKIKAGDIVVLELDSWCLSGFRDIKKSPQISVFTNLFPDHLNYYLKGGKDEAEAMQKYFEDKAQIFANQKVGDYLILDKEIKEVIDDRYKDKIESKIILIKDNSEIKGWKLKIKGEHNIRHILRAIEVAKILDINIKLVKKVIENFRGVEGRLEFLREYKGIGIYNDTTATTPEALEVALKSLRVDIKNGRLITISGGADKKLNNKQAAEHIIKYANYAFLLAGSGTEIIKDIVLEKMGNRACVCDSLKMAVESALVVAKKGDIIVLSPGFASFGMFKNEYDRGNKFNNLIKALK